MGTVQLKTCVAAFAAMVCAGTAQADGNVTVFGKLDAGVDMSRSGNGWHERVISSGYNGSRLGFAGKEDLGGGLSAIFRIVMGFNTDTGTLAQGGRAFGREATVGFASKQLGSLVVGRVETPAYRAHILYDAFQFGISGTAEISRSMATTSGQLLPLANNTRADNAISYMSPNLNGFTVRAYVAAGEGSASLGHAFDGYARYQKGPLDVVVEYGRQDGGSGAVGDSGYVRSALVGGSYNFGAFKLLGGYSAERNTCTTCTGALARMPGVTGNDASEFRLAQAGVRVPFGRSTLIAQIVRVMDRSNYAVSTGSRDANWFAVGGEHRLSKRTLLYAGIGTVGNQNGSMYALGTGSAQQPSNVVGAGNPRTTTLSLGINHSF